MAAAPVELPPETPTSNAVPAGVKELEPAAPATPAPESPVSPASQPTGAPIQPISGVVVAAGPPIYVKDLRHLAELVQIDGEVRPAVERLVARKNGALGVGIATGAVGLTLVVVGLNASKQSCEGVNPQFCTTGNPNVALVVSGSVVVLLGSLLGAAMMPRRNDLLEVVKAWNTRHRETPLSLDEQR